MPSYCRNLMVCTVLLCRTIQSNGGQYGQQAAGEFIKLICRERFSTDLVCHLINPTTCGDDDDDNAFDDDEEEK